VVQLESLVDSLRDGRRNPPPIPLVRLAAHRELRQRVHGNQVFVVHRHSSKCIYKNDVGVMYSHSKKIQIKYLYCFRFISSMNIYSHLYLN
jgi:hypothetical protein